MQRPHKPRHGRNCWNQCDSQRMYNPSASKAVAPGAQTSFVQVTPLASLAVPGGAGSLRVTLQKSARKVPDGAASERRPTSGRLHIQLQGEVINDASPGPSLWLWPWRSLVSKMHAPSGPLRPLRWASRHTGPFLMFLPLLSSLLLWVACASPFPHAPRAAGEGPGAPLH